MRKQIIKIETIRDLALSRFIHHSLPDISRFLRIQNLNDISAALPKATADERVLKISNEEFRQKPEQSLYCTICKRNGHASKSCFKNTTSVTSNSNSVLLNQTSNRQLSSDQNNSHNNQMTITFQSSADTARSTDM